MVELENQPPTCYNLSMSFFTSLGIVVLSMLILTFLQLTPGVFALFTHYAIGKYGRKKASYITTFYILGVETVAACLFMSTLLFSNLLFFYSMSPGTSYLSWVMAGIMVALAIASFLYYFRGGNGTKLFIPRNCAATLENYAREANSRSDAFILGALSGVLEMPFTLPLYIIGAFSVIELTASFPICQLLALAFVIVPTIPLFVIRLKYRAKYNLAEIQRARVHDKKFVRILMCFSYAAIAVLFMYLGIR